MNETREAKLPRPKDVHGNEIIMGPWYWVRDRRGQIIGTCKFACAIGGGDVTWFINGTGYSPEGYEFVLAVVPCFDVPEPTQQPSIGESVADHGRRLDEFWRRCDKIEERLAAIERAATCGTGPNEPLSFSPAQTDVGEATAAFKAGTEAEWPRYFKQNDGEGDCIYCLQNDGAKLKLFHFYPFHVTGEHAAHYRLHEVEAYVSDGIWLSVPRAEAEARIAAAKQQASTPIPSTTPATTEPTPGSCPTCGYSAWQKLLESGGHLCRVCDLAGRARDAEQMEREHRATIATLTRERDEARAKLRKRTSEVETWLGVILQANEAIDGNVDEPEKLPGRVAQIVAQLATVTAERDEARADCIRVEDAARSLGPEGYDPIYCIDAAKKQLATYREAAEAMEALEGGKVTSVQQVVTGNRWFAACLGAIHFADTPTAAILAARDAANTGEKK